MEREVGESQGTGTLSDGLSGPELRGGWLEISFRDEPLIGEWLEIMYQMSDSYRREGVRGFQTWLRRSRGVAYFYRDGEDRIALRFHYSNRLGQYQLFSVGFLGRLTPAQALDRVVEKSVEFGRERGISGVFAIQPKSMQDVGILRFYELLSIHPRLRVSVVHEDEQSIHWQIDALELLSGQETC